MLFLCTVAFNQILISYGSHASSVPTVSTNTPASECPQPGPANLSNQQIAPSASNASLPGHVVQPVKQGLARLISHVNPTLQLRVELVFNIRNEAQFQKCLDSINDPSSPEYRRYLNSTTLQPFLPSPGQKTSVSDRLTREGLSVTDGASPLVLNINGDANAIMSAFAIRLSVYSYRNSTFFASDSDPQMPSNLASLVNGIMGLENYTRARPAESPCSSPYCPQGIQIGYSISTLLSNGYTGSGQKVAVVDAPGDPDSQTAINTFDTQYGLPATTLDIIYPDGTPTSWNPGWASEAAMDIEAVHSVAPGATIVLAYDTLDLMNSVDYVASNGLASAISNSWTYGYLSDTQLNSALVSSVDSRLAIDVALGVTILFASGDKGWKPDGSTVGTQFPASDPNVLAVGATNLVLNGCGSTTCTGYGSESGASISGGGYSGYFGEPSWQTSTIGSTSAQCTTGHLNPTCRAVPDVAMLGYSPNFWVYSTASDKCGSGGNSAGWFGCAGTSLSTPLWAGFLGVALQLRGGEQFGNVAPLLYSLGAGTSYSTLFHDITAGSNGYSAGTGWDPVTGWGSPVANNLASALSTQKLITVVDAGSGTLSPNCPSASGCGEAIGSSVTVTATASSGWQFSSWSTQTGISCSNNPCTFSMPNNAVTLKATFTQLFTVTFYSTPSRFLGASSPGSTTACGGTFTNGQSGSCGSGFSATANPTSPSTGWQFDHWSWTGGVSCLSSSANPATCSASGAGSLTAVYAAQVTFVTSPSSSASIDWGSCSGPGNGNGASVFSTSYGSVTACYVPSGYTLSSWSCSGGLVCSGSNDPTLVTFNGPGTITLSLKTGSLTNPISTSLTASASPANPLHGTSLTVSGTLTANGGGVGGETIVLVFGWKSNTVAVTTAPDGSYTYTATAPSSGSYDVRAFFLGDYAGNPQYLPSAATAMITVG